jgi:hypothetical protein
MSLHTPVTSTYTGPGTVSQALGQPVVLTAEHIRSSLGPFRALPTPIKYPPSVLQALFQLYGEYTKAFKPLIESSWEWTTDYRYCSPANFAVQVDMASLTPAELEMLAAASVDEVREYLRLRIYEIDNSVAMYQLLERLYSTPSSDSLWKTGWRAALSSLSNRYSMPIALLAVTDEKYWAMAETEFGAVPGIRPSDADVRSKSGFDTFMGPEDFKRHVASQGGDCSYLLFVRSSLPVSKLRKPGTEVKSPLLSDADMRRLIRAYSITLNVDDPTAPVGAWINDTKQYMTPMGLGFEINSWEALWSPEFDDFLETRGLGLPGVWSGETHLRAKPLAASYGGYGHVRGSASNGKFRSDLRRGIKQRGPYIIQPEITPPVFTNTTTGEVAGAIERVFLAMVDDTIQFLGGYRNFMPVASQEWHEGRVHGNGEACWAQIVPA